MPSFAQLPQTECVIRVVTLRYTDPTIVERIIRLELVREAGSTCSLASLSDTQDDTDPLHFVIRSANGVGRILYRIYLDSLSDQLKVLDSLLMLRINALQTSFFSLS